MLAGYADGLAQAGARSDSEDIRLAYLASTVLRQGTFMFSSLTLELQAAGATASDEAGRALIEAYAGHNERTLVRLALFTDELRSRLG